jgi:hypothetical protein
MTTVKIDGKELTNIQSVMVGFKRDNNNRGELIGKPAPLHIMIRRDSSLKKDAQIEPFEAASRNPKKIKLQIKMPNAAGGDALTFDIDNAFVAKWNLGNITDEAASEVIEIYAGQTKLTASKANASYKVPLTIPNR